MINQLIFVFDFLDYPRNFSAWRKTPFCQVSCLWCQSSDSFNSSL